MDYHGIDSLGYMYLPRSSSLPSVGEDSIGKIHFSTSNYIAYLSTDLELNGKTIANGYPWKAGEALLSSDFTSLSTLYTNSKKGHPGYPLGASNGWIPLSDERHWHKALALQYDNNFSGGGTYTNGPFGPSDLESQNVQDAIDELASYHEYLTAGNGITGTQYDGKIAREWSVSYGGSGGTYGTATTVARSDHSHGSASALRICLKGVVLVQNNIVKFLAGSSTTPSRIVARTDSGTCEIMIQKNGSTNLLGSNLTVDSTGVTATPLSISLTETDLVNLNVLSVTNAENLYISIRM